MMRVLGARERGRRRRSFGVRQQRGRAMRFLFIRSPQVQARASRRHGLRRPRHIDRASRGRTPFVMRRFSIQRSRPVAAVSGWRVARSGHHSVRFLSRGSKTAEGETRLSTHDDARGFPTSDPTQVDARYLGAFETRQVENETVRGGCTRRCSSDGNPPTGARALLLRRGMRWRYDLNYQRHPPVSRRARTRRCGCRRLEKRQNASSAFVTARDIPKHKKALLAVTDVGLPAPRRAPAVAPTIDGRLPNRQAFRWRDGHHSRGRVKKRNE